MLDAVFRSFHHFRVFPQGSGRQRFPTDSPTPTQHPQISPLYMQVSNSRAVLTTALQDVSTLTSQEWQLCSGSELWSGLSGQGQRASSLVMSAKQLGLIGGDVRHRHGRGRVCCLALLLYHCPSFGSGKDPFCLTGPMRASPSLLQPSSLQETSRSQSMPPCLPPDTTRALGAQAKTWFDPPLIATFPRPCTLPVLSGLNLPIVLLYLVSSGTSINDVINSLKIRHPQDPGGHAAGTPARSL